MALHRGKIFRDPVYGNISLPWSVLVDLVDTPEFQRLRNIRQLGMCFTTFHGAEHSRFQHALGVAWLMHRVLEQWDRAGLVDIGLIEQQSACSAALLHDIGHGPFSHALEHVFSGVDHEALGRSIVRHRLTPLLERHGLSPGIVIDIMAGSHQPAVLSELLSSQLDVDRMDYLQRDSVYTGVKYGLFDIERIIHTLIPIEDLETREIVLAVDAKGTQAVEEFLFSRYFMHWQVYLHRTVRSAELLLRLVLERARVTYDRDPRALHVPPNLRFLFQSEPAGSETFLDNFLRIDDFDVFHAIKLWRVSSDACLADLAGRFLDRRLFKAFPIPHPSSALEEVRPLVEKRFGENWNYYVREDTPTDSAFGVYSPGSADTPIRVLLRAPGQWQEISKVTRTEAILALAQKVSQPYLMVAPECRDDVQGILHPSMEGY